MKKSVTRLSTFVLVLSLLLLACGGASEQGTLQFMANGEDFVRQGFLSKDGWSITFDHLYVNLSHLHAYQADPPYDAHAGGQPKAGTIVHLEGEYLVDLAEGGEDAPLLVVGQVDTAPAGHYNAISWEMIQAAEGPAEGYTLVLIGKAEKEGQVVPFTIRIDKEYEYTCGDYVGDERKGFLEADGTADLELTFHFDHIFGDAETPMDDDLNRLAVGFDPFAALAQGGTLDVNMTQLEAQLSAQAYQMLEEILPTLGHVGEGHCHSEVR